MKKILLAIVLAAILAATLPVGALRYHGEVLTEALRPLGLPVRRNEDADALEGLRKLFEEINQ